MQRAQRRLIYGAEATNLAKERVTGMSGPDFRMAYQLRLADDLLRYTDLPLAEVARRSGLGSHTNFCVVIRRERKQTPTERRMALRQKGDAGRYRV